jgi:hypothetical protein
MEIENNNHYFIKIIDEAIESNNPNNLLYAIQNYSNNVDQHYVNNAKAILKVIWNLDDENLNPNDNLCDAFLYEIDRSVDSGNEKFILDAIKLYWGKIDESYIKMAQNMLTNLVEEKLDSMELN